MSHSTKILYIEDDKGSQRLVQRVLENHGYTVTLADDGFSGIRLAREEPPSLILMDINLPGLNGREITTRLRALGNFQDVPIIALTANASPNSRERALAAGCDGFLGAGKFAHLGEIDRLSETAERLAQRAAKQRMIIGDDELEAAGHAPLPYSRPFLSALVAARTASNYAGKWCVCKPVYRHAGRRCEIVPLRRRRHRNFTCPRPVRHDRLRGGARQWT